MGTFDHCPVHEAIQVLQEKWTMHIVRALLDGPMGFNELGRTVGGCNPATLKLRLDHLEELGLVTRTVHSYMPPRTSYELATSGVGSAAGDRRDRHVGTRAPARASGGGSPGVLTLPGGAFGRRDPYGWSGWPIAWS